MWVHVDDEGRLADITAGLVGISAMFERGDDVDDLVSPARQVRSVIDSLEEWVDWYGVQIRTLIG